MTNLKLMLFYSGKFNRQAFGLISSSSSGTDARASNISIRRSDSLGSFDGPRFLLSFAMAGIW